LWIQKECGFVANQGLVPSSAFLDWKPFEYAGVSAAPRESLTMASFAAARDRKDDLIAAIRTTYGVELPAGPARVEGRGIAFIWSSPGQWMAIAERGGGRDLESELKKLLGDVAYVVDNSDGRVVCRVSGPRARDVLSKGIPIDLHPRAFKVNDVAITHASHIGVIIWQLDDGPTYELALFRSYADSFAHWLTDAAVEFEEAAA
jgi:sarcosine oxidase subunit gamma